MRTDTEKLNVVFEEANIPESERGEALSEIIRILLFYQPRSHETEPLTTSTSPSDD